MSKIEKEVEDLVKPKIESIGYELYDVLYMKEGSNRILRIVIDSDNGISLDDCEKVNNEIKEIIDSKDPIKEQYFVEVASPGIERILRKDWQLKKYINSKGEVKWVKKDENKNKGYIGILVDVTENTIKLDIGTIIEIERKSISQIKTIYEERND